MEYNSGSNRASNFKSAERLAQGRFEITSTITPELYDTTSYYQLNVSIKKFYVKKSLKTSFVWKS